MAPRRCGTLPARNGCYIYRRAWTSNPTTPPTAPLNPRSPATALPTFLDVDEALDAALDALLAAADAEELPEDAMLAAEEAAAELADAELPVLAALDPAGVADSL